MQRSANEEKEDKEEEEEGTYRVKGWAERAQKYREGEGGRCG